MPAPADNHVCLICAQSEAELPLAAWRFQGREFWICPDCLPRLIHHRAELAERLAAVAPAEPPSVS
ncbi:MAG: hypothetical protein JNK29_17925 [Anaerolineales bacterium]|nr:hypothetical protein [Anaerolineales bacterium]